MIPLFLCLALLFLALPGTAPVLAEDLFRLAFAALATALRLLVHRFVSGGHRDFR
jgi:hypothetical protein